MGRIIIPEEISAVVTSFKIANGGYRENINRTLSAVVEFVDNAELEGAAWDNIKTQLLDYELLFTGVLSALEDIDSNCDLLTERCGKEILIEDEIRTQIEHLQAINKRYWASIHAIQAALWENPLAAVLDFNANLTLFNCKIATENNECLITTLYDKLSDIKRIEQVTSNLFTAVSEILVGFDGAVIAVGAAWNGSGFATDLHAPWRISLSKRHWEVVKKKNLEDILSQYQVEDDEILYNWKLGWPYSLFMEPIPQLTKTEADLIRRLAPWILPTFKDAKENAYAEADRRFPQGSQDDSHNDAFRHAYWNALMTTGISESFASQFTTAHEGVPGNPPHREAMDLYNNEVGRRIAANNPGAPHEKLADLIEQAVNNGELLVIDGNGNIAWSNQVPLGQCGKANGEEAPLPGRPRGEFTNNTGSG